MRPFLIFGFSIFFVYGLSACSDSAPSSSMVQFLVTNKSTKKINRLTIFLEEKDTTKTRLVDSVFITNIPDNLPIRLTYDINKNSSTGNYKLVALGTVKKWNIDFGKFSEKTDTDSDHLYNLEILEDSVSVIP
ncbi:hypothetical protein [Dyadobacter frigoris]|uniref:Uncharacterized protein n=1 Tax=Dyadobacter frigoris TaxID=2576211 RepID=A0A4U6D2U3_9BACT|nr:hypothetical protein [Dyadobacter frigoris]TKT91580.1 hypothetical protein FDK13_14525 [Dyadobacter frigoris]